MDEIKTNAENELRSEDLNDVSGGASKGRIITYTVVRGDTLWKLANKYKTTMDEIMRLNPIIKKPELIVTGWKLLIPDNR